MSFIEFRQLSFVSKWDHDGTLKLTCVLYLKHFLFYRNSSEQSSTIEKQEKYFA